MIHVHESAREPVTLRFYGGFFSALPGIGEPVGMEAHFRFAESVRVRANGESCPRLEAELTSAVRLDFVSDDPLSFRNDGATFRALSHVLPIDYHGFRKTVCFKGGEVTGRFDAGHLEEKRGELNSIVDELGESVEAFCRFTGIGGHHDEHIEALSAEFFRQMSKGADNLSLWLDGYSVDVELRLHRVLVNGYVERGHEPSPEQILTLPEGAVLTFRPVAGSHLPHYPASNPHVLEQPPTL